MPTPDDLVRKYFRLRESAGLAAIDPVAQVGRIYAKRCFECDATVCQQRQSDRVEVCGLCGERWYFEDRIQLKGQFQQDRNPGTAENRIAFVVDLGVVISAVYDEHTWPARVFYGRALSPWLGSRKIAREAAQVWPDAPFAWNPRNVLRLEREGRTVLSERLVTACLMEPETF